VKSNPEGSLYVVSPKLKNPFWVTKSLSLNVNYSIPLRGKGGESGGILDAQQEKFILLSEGREQGDALTLLVQEARSVQRASVDEMEFGQL